MLNEIIKKILESLGDDANFPEMYPKFSGEGYTPCRIDAKNFRRIGKPGAARKIAFIDGGNAQIIGSANFSLSLVRVSCSAYLGGKKISSKKCEFFALINAAGKDDEIVYKASFYGTAPHFLEKLEFDSLDKTLMHGINRAEIGGITNAIRRFAELRMAKIISDAGNFCDIMVLDGTLQATVTHEKKHMDELQESCSRNGVILTAVGKTSSLFTDSGNLLSAVLGKMSDMPSWIYHPVAEISNESHKAEMFFAKLHSRSSHVFRLEVLNSQKNHAEDAISALAGYCNDPIFPGYPYGLVEADRAARVSNQEKESLKAMFLFKMRDKGIEKYLSSANAHQILDKISF